MPQKEQKTMERKEFNERIQKDFEQFKASILELPNEKIFEKGFEIDFKSNMTEYLQNDELVENEFCESLSKIDGSVLDVLFNIYLNNDTYYTYEDLCEEIVEIYDSENSSDNELE